MKVGTIIANRYTVKSQVGQGGTSRVYKVYDNNVGRNLAMKVIECEREAYYMLARGEIETLRSIRYPLFPTIYDAFADGKMMYILSDFIEGERLDFVIRRRRITRDEALRLVGRIADAVAYLHEMDPPILYLDLKPENIILCDNGLPMLVDFGIAGQITQRRVCMGTYGYSPPEQYDIKGEAVDERSDIFALGMTYFAIRCRSFPDKDFAKNRVSIRKSSIFNKYEKSFLLRATSFEKSDRFTCMTDVKREIQHIREYPKILLKRAIIVLVLVSAGLLGGYQTENSLRAKREKEAAVKMLDDASEYLKDGEYTAEGMEIIKKYVQSGTLNEKTEQEFIFEIARNALFVQQDYKTASIYYSKLDEKEFPGAGDYSKFCRMISGFESFPEDEERLVKMYYGDVITMKPSVYQFENILFAAGLFRDYETDDAEGIKKSITVLRNGMEIIDDNYERISNVQKPRAIDIRRQMDEQLAVLEISELNRKREKQIGRNGI